MTLTTNIANAFTRVGTEFKAIRTLIGGSGTAGISALTTTDKSSLVAAINETKAGNAGSPADASTTTKGIIEIATLAEVTTGTDTTRAVTPQGVKQEIDLVKVDASTTTKGLVELATLAEVTAGTDTTRAVTPEGVKQAFDAAIAVVVGGAPGTLDTLNELAAALGDDASFAATVASFIADVGDTSTNFVTTFETALA